jgi:Lysyl oxidase
VARTTSWNNGAGPLELRAGEIDTVGNRQNVYQRVYLSDGQPFNAPGGSQRTSSKTTFCVMDTTKINTSLPGAPGSAVYTTCGNTIQGMSVGWGDTYRYYLEGQSIDFTGNPSGDYKLIIEIDPKKRIIESNEEDNISCVLLRINVTNSSVIVLNSTGCDGPAGGVVVTSIQPSSSPRGSLTPVTITGSGFTAGVQVSLENGSNPRPTVSNVRVLDANTITADVAVKSGGGGRDRVWDVRVGSSVLPDGFTVLP